MAHVFLLVEHVLHNGKKVKEEVVAAYAERDAAEEAVARFGLCYGTTDAREARREYSISPVMLVT